MRRFLIVVFFQSLRLPDQSWQKENCKYPAKAHTAWNTLMKPYAWIYKAWTIIIIWIWQAYNLPHFLKLIGSQKQVAKTPTTTRAQTSERDMSVVFLCVLCCLLAVQTTSSPYRGLFISGWNHVEIEWKCPHVTFVAQHGFKLRSVNIMLFWQKQNLILLLK